MFLFIYRSYRGLIFIWSFRNFLLGYYFVLGRGDSVVIVKDIVVDDRYIYVYNFKGM